MLRYLSAKSYKHLNKLNKIWNKEFKHSYPLSDQIFKIRLLDDPDLNKDASFVALYDGDVVGFIFVKTQAKDSGLLNENTVAHLSLIFVKKELRHMGIGSDLVKLALAEIKKYETINSIVVGDDVHVLFPGVPSEFNDASLFFMNKGFIQKENVVDMIHVIRRSPFDNPVNNDLTIRIATEEDKDEILKLCISNGLNIEAYKLNEYYERGGSGRRIAVGLKDNKIVCISRFNEENKLNFNVNRFINKHTGNIAFIIVDKSLDRHVYETIMLSATKDYMIKRGCNKIVAVSVKDPSFYKEFGYSAYKMYLNYEYKIK